MIGGQCLCGQVAVTLSRRPGYINMCNCRLCRATGAAWGYFDRSEVTVTGQTAQFVRSDMDDPWLTIHFCPRCGSTTHYDATPAHPSDRLGVNTRLFAQDALDGVPVTYQDGRAVMTEDDHFVTTGSGTIGDGKAF